MNKKYNVALYYGYEEGECGIYHAFRAVDPAAIVDDDLVAAELAEQLDCTLEDLHTGKFNYNSMYIELPESLIEKIKTDAVLEHSLGLMQAAPPVQAVEDDLVLPYKNLTIFGKDGVFTIGGKDNASFDDCTLENLGCGPDEFEIVQFCRECGIPVRYDDLYGDVYDVPYEKYLEHLGKYDVDPEESFLANEFVVPSVRCVSIEQAKSLIDWIQAKQMETVQNILSHAEKRASAQVDIIDAVVRESEAGLHW